MIDEKLGYDSKTQSLIDRMCKYVERKDYILKKKVAEEKILKTYDLFNLPRPKKIKWLDSPFDEKFARSAGSAGSAWSAEYLYWTGLDYDFDYYVMEYEYILNPSDNQPNENDRMYRKYSKLLLEALEAGLGYRVEWEDTLYLVSCTLSNS